ncbi:ribose transport system substrate-binding protein/inositol transport system substrate-binding protein [Endobacter medicaginis]|uniref:Ribose transport system substrate-binding protein/inositol transport system substrate-binding protein n=1 Tax=Endobacter medicaginis TaxID=1181271 RepID=A0A850NQ05_9PROT|nr:substrate-binding domain-containing protein [Endobacter medicaginis]MBB3172565.1 ribose transport system substrate-binding protein/inositol transport system substrate-binding protein [Endobacter medicaginis]MCX5473947.1 substrate-binding domain-containing protein [Endobacter medicaginis]NVN29275.1 substrate-binding domain-containing protein [Endobacter medicaginis]
MSFICPHRRAPLVACRTQAGSKRRSMTTLAALTTLATLAMSPVAAAAGEIGVTMVPPVGFFKFLRDGIDARAHQLSGVNVSFAYAEAGAGAAQVEQVRQFIQRHVDALIVLPADAGSTSAITALAIAAHTPLVFVNNGPRQDWFAGRVALAIPNDIVAGRLQAEKLAEELHGKGQIVLIMGPASHSAAAMRTQGVRDVLVHYPDIHVIETASADWDRQKARELVAGWLGKGDHFDAVAANNDEMALGAVAALADAGLPDGRIIVAGVDGLPDAVAAIKAHKLSFSVLQDAALEGRKALDDALGLAANAAVQQYDWVPFDLMTEQTLAQAATSTQRDN